MIYSVEVMCITADISLKTTILFDYVSDYLKNWCKSNANVLKLQINKAIRACFYRFLRYCFVFCNSLAVCSAPKEDVTQHNPVLSSFLPILPVWLSIGR